MPASFQILSDLHLEHSSGYAAFTITPKAPYLALLGDIGNVCRDKEQFRAFLKVQLRQFRIVFFVAGNHEAYGSDWEDTVHELESFEHEVRQDDGLGEFVLLNRKQYRIPGCDTVVLGCSLFSYIPDGLHITLGLALNDFRATRAWDTDLHNEEHARDLTWLNDSVSALDAEGDGAVVVIFTHWSPTVHPTSMDPKHFNTPLSHGFTTNLRKEACFRSRRVRLWAFGHTHYNCDFVLDREKGEEPIRLVTNQKGYEGEKVGNFDPEGVVVV
ncbi:hypothetical protein C2857_001046 [Epichloe festucae Fl1]|uniref:Calcineurin-like phosphoesterase domain-containing protein n=1 Tax=Epichloe festucae (strain Fl1) TaxID=877507 RepID=A0A7S9PS12_EPIFF|nr:hypothetical protein C2857_001046 [Epichloe festucae Fl1]